MNPRILKKLSKRIVDLQHPIAKGAWLEKERIGGEYIGNRLFGDRKVGASGKLKRSHYMTKSSISGLYVLGCWGEDTSPFPVFHEAAEYVLWKVGKRKQKPIENDHAVIVDCILCWPETKKRLTGQSVLEFLRGEVAG